MRTSLSLFSHKNNTHKIEKSTTTTKKPASELFLIDLIHIEAKKNDIIAKERAERLRHFSKHYG